MKFTLKIKRLLLECGDLSEAELARRLNIKPPTLHKKMKVDNFHIKDLQEIADALGVELEADVHFKLPDGTKI